MTAGICLLSDLDEHNAALEAFAAGAGFLRRDYDSDFQECEVLVTWGIQKKLVETKRGEGYARWLAQHKGRHIVIEKGFVRRDEYYAVGIGGLNGRAFFNNYDVSDDRWRALGVPLKNQSPLLDAEAPEVLCLQVPHDTSVQHIDYRAWATEAARYLCARAELVVIRRHPLSDWVPRIPAEYGGKTKLAVCNLERTLAAAGRVHAFSSNILVDATIAGCAALAYDNGAMIPMGMSVFPRREWASRMGYCQWTIEEMRRGHPWRHLAGVL